MALFGKKKQAKVSQDVNQEFMAKIHTMPGDFRSKPFTQKKQEQSVTPSSQVAYVQTPPPTIAPHPTMPVAGPSNHVTRPIGKTSKKWMWILAGGIGIVMIGGILAIIFSTPNDMGTVPATNMPANVALNGGTQISDTPTPPASEDPLITPPTSVVTPVLPRILPSSRDSDGDGLTDVEEQYFLTDPNLPDTDGDGFPDGTEVENLYNPIGFAPVRIIDSGLVNIYQHPQGIYEFYYPATWEVQPLLQDPLQVLITPPDETGEFFNITVIENMNRTPLVDWYIAQSIEGIQPHMIKRLKNRRGQLDGILSLNEQTAYFSVGQYIYVIHYNSGILTELNFKTTFKSIYESFVARPIQANAIFPFVGFDAPSALEQEASDILNQQSGDSMSFEQVPLESSGMGEEEMQDLNAMNEENSADEG